MPRITCTTPATGKEIVAYLLNVGSLSLIHISQGIVR